MAVLMECRSALQKRKQRAPVAPGRHKEVNLAAKQRVMCLHLNEKARKERDTEKGEGEAELRGRGLCQAETLEECIGGSSGSSRSKAI